MGIAALGALARLSAEAQLRRNATLRILQRRQVQKMSWSGPGVTAWIGPGT